MATDLCESSMKPAWVMISFKIRYNDGRSVNRMFDRFILYK